MGRKRRHLLCAYCGTGLLPRGTRLSGGVMHPRAATRDHVFPKAYGGIHTVDCCHQCNGRKGNQYPDQWLKHVLWNMPERAEAVREVYRRFKIQWSEPAT